MSVDVLFVFASHSFHFMQFLILAGLTFITEVFFITESLKNLTDACATVWRLENSLISQS